MIALSTAWNNAGKYSMEEMLRQIRDLGFNAIELSYDFSPEKLEELIVLLRDAGTQVVSVHNFCPLPSEKRKRYTADYYRLSSQDQEERKRAVDYTKRTIDTACRLSCKAVVIHAGTIELEAGFGRNLISLYNKGKAGTEEYNELKRTLLDARHKEKAPFIDSTIKSLEEVVSYAYRNKVKIGLETRYYFNEIPDIEEVELFLELFGNRGLFYWHDTGHAEINERLGIMSHARFLERFRDRMLGMHIHDIKGTEDHFAPFSGDIDFSKLLPYISADLIKVIEAHSQATFEQLRIAFRRLS